MAYELFTQEGFGTHIKMGSGYFDVFSNDYTGKSLRECNSDKKKMISVSSGQNIQVSSMIKGLRDAERETHIADVQSLARLRLPVIDSDLMEVLDECRYAIVDDVTFNLAHTKYSAIIELIDTKEVFAKEHEHVCALVEDCKNLDVVYVLNISRDNLVKLPNKIKQAIDWFAIQRKLTKQIPSGKFSVVLSNEACGTLFHEIVGHQFELSSSHSIHSPNNYPDGYKLFSEKINVYDKPFELTTPHDYDDEGTKCRQTHLLANGRIVTPLTDKRSIVSFPEYNLTGNARRESFLNYPCTRFFRISVGKGTSTFRQAVSDIEYGIYIDHVSAARFFYLEDRVTLNASKSYVIRKGVVTDEPMSCFVDDKISSFFFPRHVCNEVSISPGFCNSSSGYLYVEHESPIMSFDNINVKDVLTYET